jgi:hypothetical protein
VSSGTLLHALGPRGLVSALATIAVVAALVGGCNAGNSGTEATVLTIDHAGFRLTVPDGWSAQATNNVEGPLQTVAFLSSVPLEIKCSGSGTSRHCREPRTIADGSLLVTWLAAYCAGTSCVPPPGQPLLIGGREASLVSDAQFCELYKPTKAEIYFVAVSPQRLDAVVVCEHDAPEAAEAALRQMLEHIEWRTP